MREQIFSDAAVFVLIMTHFKIKVFPVESRDSHMGLFQAEHPDNVLFYLLCGGGGKRADNRTGGKGLDKFGNL